MFSLLFVVRNVRPTSIRTIFKCCCNVNVSSKDFNQRFKFKKKIVNNNHFIVVINRALHSQKNSQSSKNETNINDKKLGIALSNISNTINKHGRIFLDQIYDVVHSNRLHLTEDQVVVLLQCCGNLLPDQVPEVRAALCEHVKETLEKFKIPLNYHLYVDICTENNYQLNYKKLLKEVEEPDTELYKKILKNACYLGDISMAINILEEMKNKSISVDEEIFNSLTLAHALHGGLDDAKTVLETMRTGHLFPSTSTYVSLLTGLAKRNNEKQFENVVQLLPSESLDEKPFLEIVQQLAQNDNQNWIDHLIPKKKFTSFSKQNLRFLDNLCIHLIYLEKPLSAIYVYTKLVQQHSDILEGNYGMFLLREMVKKGCNISEIFDVIRVLKELNLNPWAHEKITETALRRNYHEIGWELVKNMKPLRPHYFWPLLRSSTIRNGEVGLFKSIEKMINLNVKPDEETLEYYILPFCDLTNPMVVINQLKKFNFTSKVLFTPLIKVLLQKNYISQVLKLVKIYDGIIDGSTIKPLTIFWMRNKNAEDVVPILQKICETNMRSMDWAGQFLERICDLCRNDEDFSSLESLLKIIQSKKLRLSSHSANYLSNVIKTKCTSSELQRNLEELVDTLLDVSFQSEEQHILHPRNMNVQELECHYEELKYKRMETRGVLRRLIQAHARLGNVERVKELRSDFLKQGYSESPGMKANIFHIFVQTKNINEADHLYDELTSRHPWFQLDSFKILDYAALMVADGKEDNAINLVKKEHNVKTFQGSRGIEHNCVDLLKSFKSVDKQKTMFELLIQLNYCSVNCPILEPLVQIHLKSNDVDKALEAFIMLSKKYKMIPAESELLCALIENNRQDLFQEVINAAEAIDRNSAYRGLIEALSKKKLHKSLRKVILSTNWFTKENLQTLCNNWVKNGQLTEFQTFTRAIKNVPNNVIDKTVVYNSIMQLYSNKNDCESALELWLSLEEDNEDFRRIYLDAKLKSLLERCKYEPPEEVKTKLYVAR